MKIDRFGTNLRRRVLDSNRIAYTQLRDELGSLPIDNSSCTSKYIQQENTSTDNTACSGFCIGGDTIDFLDWN